MALVHLLALMYFSHNLHQASYLGSVLVKATSRHQTLKTLTDGLRRSILALINFPVLNVASYFRVYEAKNITTKLCDCNLGRAKHIHGPVP